MLVEMFETSPEHSWTFGHLGLCLMKTLTDKFELDMDDRGVGFQILQILSNSYTKYIEFIHTFFSFLSHHYKRISGHYITFLPPYHQIIL